jgi:hypothetical protein
MSSYQILDSSPIRIPSLHDTEVNPRPLKRSASLASLPTPPRTHHKRSRSKAASATSRYASEDSGSASELEDNFGGSFAARVDERHSKSGDETSGDKEGYALMGRKKRRTTNVLPAHDEEEDDENSFWTGRSGGAASHGRKKSPELEDQEDDKSPSPALLKYRVREPVSPPPSRRAPQVQPRASSVQRSRSPPPALLLPKPPVTPPRRLFLRAPPSPSNSKAKKIWPTRDSPDNPFLAGEVEASTSKASDWESSDDELPVGEAPERESTPTPAPVFEEKPTITYVLCVSFILNIVYLLTTFLAEDKKRPSITPNIILPLKSLRPLNYQSITQISKWLRHAPPAGFSPTSLSASPVTAVKTFLRTAPLVPNVPRLHVQMPAHLKARKAPRALAPARM